uniref:Uncharacterized protein n=1 Tax=Leersia perrieri TaxID=77586 RepID=A0A0D9VFP9_9ORYZ
MTRAPRRKRRPQHRCTSSSSRGDGAAGSRAERARVGNLPAKSRKNKGGTPLASDAAAAAPTRALGRAVGLAATALPFMNF